MHMDIMTPNGGQGQVADYIASEGALNPGMLRPWIADDGRTYFTVYKGTGDPAKPESYKAIHVPGVYGTLRRDEWKQLDAAVLRVSMNRLIGIQDLINAGLTYPLGNAMGTTVLEHHTMSNAMEAVISMDGETRAQGDRIKYKYHYLPIPIIHTDFEISARTLEASRKMGNPLDTDSVELGTRKINEQLEALLFTNTTYSFGEKGEDNRNSIYSYLSHPDRNLGSLTGAWTGLTGAQIIQDVVNMKQALINAKHYGPYQMYIPTAYETTLDKDYDATTPGTTIRERILKIQGISGIKIADTMPTAQVLMVQMTSDVVRLVQGFGVQVVQWQTGSKFTNKFKVLTIQVPQVRADQEGNSGIAHFSV